MFMPFDTAHLTHRSARHSPANDATRHINRQMRAARIAAMRALVSKLRKAVGWFRRGCASIRTRVSFP